MTNDNHSTLNDNKYANQIMKTQNKGQKHDPTREKIKFTCLC